MNTGGYFGAGESSKSVPENTSDEGEATVSDLKGPQSKSGTLQDSGCSSKDILKGYIISFAHYNFNSMYMCLVCIIKK